MPEWFDVTKDDQGTISEGAALQRNITWPSKCEGAIDLRGVTVYTGLVILQTRLAALESICGHSQIGSEAGRGNAGQAPRTAIKRMGRVDRCRFGWRPDPRNNAKLLPDQEEQETIGRARLLAAAGLSLREICRRLDQQGRDAAWQEVAECP